MNDSFFVETVANYMSLGVGIFFVGVLFCLLIGLVLRPFWLWYFKINIRIRVLTEIRDSLTELKTVAHKDLNPQIGSDTDASSSLIEPDCKIDKPLDQSVADKKWMPPKETK